MRSRGRTSKGAESQGKVIKSMSPKIPRTADLEKTLEVLEMIAGTCFNVPYLPQVSIPAQTLASEIKGALEFRRFTGYVDPEKE